MTVLKLFGCNAVTRISAGRYRCMFSAARSDTSYMTFSDIVDGNIKFARTLSQTTTFTELQVAHVTTTMGAVAVAAADAGQMSFRVERIV
ncbi:MAG TPA: hypothetical protein VGU45_04950 [Microvirga sp.]|nr:hypothetical protein [Microvirga sp.]